MYRMRIDIVVECDDNGKEYVLGPYGEWEHPPESKVTIHIKSKDKDIEQEIIDEINKN